MNRLCLAALLAAGAAFCAPALSSDYRQLNHEAVQAIKSGDYDRAESLLEQALAAYTPEPANYDQSIRNNLSVLRQHKAMAATTKRSADSSLPLVGYLSQVSYPTVEGFAQPYFEKLASSKLNGTVKVQLGPSNVRRIGAGVYELHFRAAAQLGRTLEISARVQDRGNGIYNMLEIHADSYRPVALRTRADNWDLLATLASQPSTMQGLSKEDASVEKVKLGSELRAASEESAQKAQDSQDNVEAKATEAEADLHLNSEAELASSNSEDAMKAAAAAAVNNYAAQLMAAGKIPVMSFD